MVKDILKNYIGGEDAGGGGGPLGVGKKREGDDHLNIGGVGI